ncbi:MAG: glycosyltransferase family 39 protein, partial [Planctomycetes bacterium]|nr:glycosyltransferase family 39 protein [Planctomycetota bacterium]
LALLGILALAAALRVWGCFGQGLPHSYYPDERNNVERVLRFGAEKTLDPNGWFNKPALGYYVILVEYGGYYAVGRACGWWGNPYEFGVSYFVGQGPFLLIGRLSTALFGVLTVLLVYRMARKVGDQHTGLMAALVMAVTLGHIASSQQVKMDVPAAFWNTWCVLMLVSVINRGRWRDYVLAGFFAGLGVATKYYSFAMVLPICLAHMFRTPEARSAAPRIWLSPRPLGALAALFGGFFAGSPYNTLDGWWLGRFWNLLQWIFGRMGVSLGEFQSGAARGSSLVTEEHTLWDSFARMAQNFWSHEGAGPVIASLALLGCVVCIVRRTRVHVFLLCTTLTSLLLIGMANQQFPAPRHLNILYPLLAVFAALGAQEGCRLPGRAGRAVLPLVTVCMLAPLPGFPLGAIVTENRLRNEEDPRNRVLAWLEENLPSQAAVVNDHGRLHLVPDAARCKWVMDRLRRLIKSAEVAIERAASEPDKVRAEAVIAFNTDRLLRLRTRVVEWKFRSSASARHRGPHFDVLTLHHNWMTEHLARRPHASLGYSQLWPRSPWADRFNPIVLEMLADGRDPTPQAVEQAFLDWLQRAYLPVGVSAVLHEARRARQEIRTLDEVEVRATEWLQREWATMEGEWLAKAPSIVELWRRSTPLSRAWLTSDKDSGSGRRAISFFVSLKRSYSNYTDPRRPWKRRAFPDWAELYDDLERNYDCWEFNSDDPDEGRVVRVWDLRERKRGVGKVRVVWR